MSPSPAPNDHQILLDAGLRLLSEGRTAASLQPEALCAAAGRPVASFATAFSSLLEFRLALFQALLDAARTAAAQAAADQPRGPIGLKRGIEAYLDSHLRHPAVRELNLLLRSEEAGQDLLARRIAGFHRVLQVGLSALRSLHPLAGAQLLTAMVAETSQAEYEARRPLAEMRETVYAYIDRLVP
jgi:hypothetical protein